MSGICREQQKRDEQSVALILVFINLALLGALVAVCISQSS
jgi:hypothetical protein